MCRFLFNFLRSLGAMLLLLGFVISGTLRADGPGTGGGSVGTRCATWDSSMVKCVNHTANCSTGLSCIWVSDTEPGPDPCECL